MTYKLLLGDCKEKLKELPDNSVDSIVTDPPYGLSTEPDMMEVLQHWMNGDDYKHSSNGFMGKSWDSFVPGPSIWKECFRVLKPGGHILAFFGSRTYDMGVLAIRLAGFEVRDQIGWIFGTGFPKSLNVGKAIDATLLTGGSHSTNIKSANELRPGDARETGTLPNNGIMSGDRKSGVTNDNAATEEAKKWEGWGTALKPAFEPIVVARKPLIGTVAQNVLEYGTGAINIDDCRVPHVGESLGGGNNSATVDRSGKHEGWQRPWMNDEEAATKAAERSLESTAKSEELGRWPANIIHDGSDEVVELFPDSKGTPNGGNSERNSTNVEKYWGQAGGGFKIGRSTVAHNDSGSAARFFYCAKASKKDRDAGMTTPEKSFVQFQTANGASGKPSSLSEGRNTAYRNTHPTVKPTELMKYLCRLVTPIGGTILDPFMGSGSTGRGAVSQGFNFIGIEMSEEYIEIAKQRIADAVINTDEDVVEQSPIKNNEPLKEEITQKNSIFSDLFEM